MTEKEARASGREIMISTRPMSRVGRANERGETKGFMKVIADAETKQILGAAILGIEGDEAIHGFIDAMNARHALPGAAMGGADPSDGVGADPDIARRPEGGLACEMPKPRPAKVALVSIELLIENYGLLAIFLGTAFEGKPLPSWAA
jgi:hypothetical protein